MALRAVGRREAHDPRRLAGVRDEHLRAVEPVLVALPYRGRLDARDVGAGVGLGQREGRDEIAAQRRRQVAGAQRLGPVLVDEVGAHQRLHRRRRGDRQRAPRELLGEQAVRHHVGVGAAVPLGIAEGQVPELADAPEQPGRELPALVERRRRRRHLRVDEARHAPAELLLLARERDHPGAPRRRRVAASSTRRSRPAPVRTTPYRSRAASTETWSSSTSSSTRAGSRAKGSP